LNAFAKRQEILFRANLILKISQEDGIILLLLVIIWMQAARAPSDSSLMESKHAKLKSAYAYNQLATLAIQRMAHSHLEQWLT